MFRIRFEKQSQFDFLNNIRKRLEFNWSQLAKFLGVHPRSLSHWKTEKYTLPEEVFKKCTKIVKRKSDIPSYEVLPNFWNTKEAGRKGALAVKNTYRSRRLNLRKEILRKKIFKPRETYQLAEFFGILLGDGGITDNQVIISLNRKDNKDYSIFISKMIRKLFKIKAPIYYYHTRSHKNNITVTVSSKNLIEFLLLKGLKKGNKVRQQVGVPLWIQNDIQFSKGCLKGLIDTDGGIYYHRHQSQGYKCFNIGLCFTNKSVPILIFIQRTLEQLGFTPKLNKKSVNLYREQEVCRYAREIGFSNSYHFGRLKEFFKMKYGEVSRMVRHMPGKHEPRKGFAGSSPVLSA